MQEEQGQQMQVNIDAVLESMGQQVARLSRDVAVKDGMLNALQQENKELKAKIDELAEEMSEDKKGRPIKAVKGE